MYNEGILILKVRVVSLIPGLEIEGSLKMEGSKITGTILYQINQANQFAVQHVQYILSGQTPSVGSAGPSFHRAFSTKDISIKPSLQTTCLERPHFHDRCSREAVFQDRFYCISRLSDPFLYLAMLISGLLISRVEHSFIAQITNITMTVHAVLPVSADPLQGIGTDLDG